MRAFFLLAFLPMLVAVPAAAQTSPFIIDRARSDRAPPPQPAPVPRIAAPAPDNRLAGIEPFVLTGIRIEGSSLAPDILSAAAKPYIGRRIGAAALTTIANAVSTAYGAQGDIALYTVTVPEQNFSGGLLRLIVFEGYIAHVDLGGDVQGDLSRVTAYAESLTRERPLKRSSLQRALSLMRDIPGLTIDARMQRGTEPGAVVLSVILKQKDHLVGLSLNDLGAGLLGRYQGQADMSFYGLLRQGEETKLSFGTSTIFSRYQYYGFSETRPVDDDGTNVQAVFGYLKTRVPSLALSGAARTLQVLVSHPLIRGFDENLSLSGGIDGTDSTNALFGETIANERVRALRLSSGYSLSDAQALLAFSGSMSFGLGVLGAHEPAPTNADTNFKKFALQARYNRLLGEDWIMRLRAVTQLGFSPLPVSELYALGGPDFGRAFLAASALGDTALAGSAELGVRPGFLPDFLKGSEVFVFADDGGTWYRARGGAPAQDYSLASAGLGVRFPLGAKTRLDLQLADGLSAAAPGLQAGAWRFLFALSAAY